MVIINMNENIEFKEFVKIVSETMDVKLTSVQMAILKHIEEGKKLYISQGFGIENPALIVKTKQDLIDEEIKQITGFTFDELPRWMRRQTKDRRGVPKGRAKSDAFKGSRHW